MFDSSYGTGRVSEENSNERLDMRLGDWTLLVLGILFLFLVYADIRYSRPVSLIRQIAFFALGVAFLIPVGIRLKYIGLLSPIIFLIMFVVGVTLLAFAMRALLKSEGFHAPNLVSVIAVVLIAMGLMLPALSRVKELGLAYFFR